jgi:hypothetical protein
MVVVRPALMERLFGGDWYRQQIFVDHTHYFLGQPGRPTLLWNTEGLMFRVDWSRMAPDSPYRSQPFWVMFYSMDKKMVYRVALDCAKSKVSIISSCHTLPGPERVYRGTLEDGIRCEPQQAKPTSQAGGK